MNQTLTDLLVDKDLTDLQKLYGEFPLLTRRIEMGPDSLESYRSQLKRRRGEILLVLNQPTGEVLMHTKHFYPQGIYRLLTGGIDWNEPVAAAWHRELWEETQLKSSGERLLGVIGYEFVGYGQGDRALAANDICVPFVSFIFQQSAVTGEPKPLDESEQISDFQWMSREGVKTTADELRGLDRISSEKGDWGRFRAVGHDFVYDAAW